MDAQYLRDTVGTCLSACLAEVCQKRPTDPIEYIAYWLYKHVENVQTEKERIAEERELERQREEYRQELEMQELRRLEQERIAKEEELRRLAMEEEARRKEESAAAANAKGIPETIAEHDEPPSSRQENDQLLAGDPADENQLHGLESEISVPMGTDVNDEQGDGEEEEEEEDPEA